MINKLLQITFLLYLISITSFYSTASLNDLVIIKFY